MITRSPNNHALLVALIAAGCQTTVNVSGASATVTDTDSDGNQSTTDSDGSGNGTTDPQTTGDPNTTSGKPDSSSGEPDTTSTSSGTDTDTTTDDTGKLDTSTSGNTTDETGSTSTSGDTTGKPDTTSTSGNDTTGGDPVSGCPNGWTRARTITITNDPEKPLTNFQISIKVVWDDDMNVDFSDLRFVDAMGTPLPYWLEDFTVPIDALVWVKVPAIAAAGTTEIEMCYGNPDAVSESDGVATFHFFDGFDGNTLDPTKWETTHPVEFSLGALKVFKGSVYSKVSPGSFPNLLIEMRARFAQGQGAGQPTLTSSSAQIQADPILNISVGGVYSGQVNNQMPPIFAGHTLQNNQGCCDGTVYNVYGLALDEGYAWAFAQRKWSASGKATWKKPLFLGLGGGMKNAGEVDFSDMSVDWVLIRKFTNIEPTNEVGPEKAL